MKMMAWMIIDHNFMSPNARLNPDGELIPIQQFAEMCTTATRRSTHLAEKAEQHVLDSDQMNNEVVDSVANLDSDHDPPAFMSRSDGQSLCICIERDVNLTQQAEPSGASDRPPSPGPAVVYPIRMSPHIHSSRIRARVVVYDKNLVTLALNTGPQMSSTLGPALVRLKKWQQNSNKSRAAHEDLINSDVFRHYDILVLQERYIDKLRNTKATKDWRVVCWKRTF